MAARRASCESLADLALDLLAAPASQAYIERVFLFVGCSARGEINVIVFVVSLINVAQQLVKSAHDSTDHKHLHTI